MSHFEFDFFDKLTNIFYIEKEMVFGNMEHVIKRRKKERIRKFEGEKLSDEELVDEIDIEIDSNIIFKNELAN